jgi:hypothetical protein
LSVLRVAGRDRRRRTETSGRRVATSMAATWPRRGARAAPSWRRDRTTAIRLIEECDRHAQVDPGYPQRLIAGDRPVTVAPPIDPRPLSEWLGTSLLLATVVGSGIMGERLAGGSEAIALLANTGATAAVLVALIHVFGQVSGRFG